MATRRSTGLFVVSGIGVALLLAFFVSPFVSSAPDGLERVAIDQGLDGPAGSDVVAGGPLADYSIAGVSSSWLSTGLSGVIGVGLCFAIAGVLVLVIRWTRSRRSRIAARGPARGTPMGG